MRVTGGLPAIRSLCLVLGCTVKYGLGDPAGQVFLVTSPDGVLPSTFLKTLSLQLGASLRLNTTTGARRAAARVMPRANQRLRNSGDAMQR